MGRGAGVVIDDPTPLNGTTVDVGARIGWVLRMARVCQDGTPGLGRVATALDTNITRLHRAETGSLRAGRIADGYEEALGLASGTLRAPIDVACRTFPYAPADRDPGELVTTVQEMSRLTDLVSAAGVAGGQWLRWARALAQPGAIGMPEPIARDLVHRLVSELSRSTSHGYPTRYEALALLRCSSYGHLVLDVAQDVVADPHVQVLYDLMSAVGEAPSPEAITWCLSLLDSDRPRIVTGAALALEAMGEVAGAGSTFWEQLVVPLLDRFDRSDAGSAAHAWLSHLLRLVPRVVLAGTGRRPDQPLALAAEVRDWSRSRLNEHWSDCQDRSLAVTRGLGLSEQPLLTRLLFEVAIGPHETRAVTSYMLLGAIPGIPEVIGAHVADIADTHPDPVVRDRAGRRLGGVLHGAHHSIAERWLAEGTNAQRDRALLLAGSAGHVVPEEVLLADPNEPALYAAGMTGHPVLPKLAADVSQPESVRGAARWWLDCGTRVVA